MALPCLYMRWCLTLLLAFLLTGCASTGGRGSRILPWNWFAPDHVTIVEESQQEIRDAERIAVKSAQIENAKTIEALKTAPPADRSVQVATRTAANAQSLLDTAVGSVPPAELLELRATIAQLLSENEEIRAQGEENQQAAEIRFSLQADALGELRSENAGLIEKLKVSDRKYQAQAETFRKYRFGFIALILLWLGLQLLSGASKFVPSLAPIARAAGYVTAPVLQAVNDKVHRGIGSAIALAEKTSTATADHMRVVLNSRIDDDNQDAVRRGYEASTRPG